MNDITLGQAQRLTAPAPFALLCVRKADGGDNLMAVSWWTYLSNHPPMLGVCLSKKGLSGSLIKQSGVFARPTCLCNVESLSIVPHLLLDEQQVYAHCGRGDSIGTKMISVAGNVNRPGVFEIPFGTTVREIIYELAGGVQKNRHIRLIQFGGASGKVADESILDTPYTYEDLRAAGVMVGSGGILVIDERTSVLDFLRPVYPLPGGQSAYQADT